MLVYCKQPAGDFCRQRLWFRYRAQIRKIIYKRSTRLTTETFGICCSMISLLRLMIALWDMLIFSNGWFEVDTFYRTAWNFTKHASSICSTAISVCIFSIYTTYFLYFRFSGGDQTVPRCFDQLNQINTRAIFKDNRLLFSWLYNPSILLRRPVRYSISTARFLWKVYNDQPLRVVFKRRLPDFPILSVNDRVKIFILYSFSEIIFSFIFVLFPWAAIFIGLSFAIPFQAQVRYPQLDWPLFAFTILTASLTLWWLLNAAFVMMCLAWGIVYTITLSFNKLNAYLDHLGHRRANSTNNFLFDYRLSLFHREHHRLTRRMLKGSQKWSPILLTSLLTNIPVNVYYLGYLIYASEGSDVGVKFLLFCLFTGQLIIGCASLLPSAYNSTGAHRAAKYFVARQTRIKNFALKLRWSHYYEVINSKRKIAYRAGFFGRITIASMFKFFFIYGEALLFCFSSLTKMNLKQ